jgi:hypothetical protein
LSIDTIYASLNQLAAAVDFLEQEMTRQEADRARKEAEAQKQAEKNAAAAAAAKAPKGQSLPGLPQNDLFSDWTAPGGRPANVNAAQLAKKLDNAIENVQWLLKGKA